MTTPHPEQFEKYVKDKKQEFLAIIATKELSGNPMTGEQCADWWLSSLSEVQRETVEKITENVKFINEFDRERESDEYDAGMKHMKEIIVSLLTNLNTQ